MESYSESYKKAGVDVTAGYKAVELMKSHIARTMTANVLTDIGGFGGQECSSRYWFPVQTA